VLLQFAEGRLIFSVALPRGGGTANIGNNRGGNNGGGGGNAYLPCKINKRTYRTDVLIGMSYGTVLEVNRDVLVPLLGEKDDDLIPDFDGGGGGGQQCNECDRDDGDGLSHRTMAEIHRDQ